jgi:hypothetical protein
MEVIMRSRQLSKKLYRLYYGNSVGRISVYLVSFALIFAIGGVFGLYLSGLSSKNQLDNGQLVGRVGDHSILPTTDVEWIYEFSNCEHLHYDFGAKNYVGYTAEELEEKIENCKVLELDSKNARIQVKIDEYCPLHYLLVYVDTNLLCVFRTNSKTYENEVIYEIEFNMGNFDKAMLEQLKNGIAFDTLEAINSYLESVET